MEDPFFPPPPPPPPPAAPPFRYRDFSGGHRRHIEAPATPKLNPVLIIVPCALAFALLLVGIAVLVKIFRGSGRKETADSLCDSSSFRKSSFGTFSFQTSFLSLCGGNDSPGDAPSCTSEARSCVYGGKMGLIALPARRRGAQVFTYRDLEVATDGFSERNVVGKGGFGVVYRGSLADGTVAAIKKLHREGSNGDREFRTEVDLLSRLHSRYLVGLLGYCADQNHRLLVFEFMPSGCLQRHLHPIPAAGDSLQQQPLDWKTRLRIALDCARGLEFLHEHTTPVIIHRDFKCSNILLDHNFRARVSDFGMAKIGSDKVNGQVLTRVLGTTGYLAPEYISTGKLTTKSDVYSFGVVLLELLTGRLPVDMKRPPAEQVLVHWALPRLTNREKVVQMVDPRLNGQFPKKELIQVAAIAAVCVQSEADYRPLMTDIVQSLIPLVKNSVCSFPLPSRPEV